MTASDQIQKQVLLRVSPARVWQALSNAEEFGRWFGVRFTGPFATGTIARGRVTHPGYDHITLELQIERMEPERLIAWRWHPNNIDSAYDYSVEPTTLVVFELQPVPEGTLLTVTESGFDSIPLARRAEAYRGNEAGWDGQMQAIAAHVEHA